MNLRDDSEWDLLAGEFALGTLSESEQQLYASIYRHDVDFQQRVAAWRERFAPLDEAVAPVEPDAEVWQAIRRELRFAESEPRHSEVAPDSVSPVDLSNDLGNDLVHDLSASLNESLDNSLNNELKNDTFGDHSADRSGELSGRLSGRFDDTTGDFSTEFRPYPRNSRRAAGNIWRSVAGIASAAALVMAIFLWYVTMSPMQQRQSGSAGFLSLIVDDQATPLWLVDGATRSSAIRLVALKPPTIPEDSAHELWLVKRDNLGFVSMGLLPLRAGETVMVKTSDVPNDATGFAVSLESENGAGGNTPTGPVLYQGSWRTLQSES